MGRPVDQPQFTGERRRNRRVELEELVVEMIEPGRFAAFFAVLRDPPARRVQATLLLFIVEVPAQGVARQPAHDHPIDVGKGVQVRIQRARPFAHVVSTPIPLICPLGEPHGHLAVHVELRAAFSDQLRGQHEQHPAAAAPGSWKRQAQGGLIRDAFQCFQALQRGCPARVLADHQRPGQGAQA